MPIERYPPLPDASLQSTRSTVPSNGQVVLPVARRRLAYQGCLTVVNSGALGLSENVPSTMRQDSGLFCFKNVRDFQINCVFSGILSEACESTAAVLPVAEIT